MPSGGVLAKKNFAEDGKDNLRGEESYSGIREYTFLLFLYELAKIKINVTMFWRGKTLLDF